MKPHRRSKYGAVLAFCLTIIVNPNCVSGSNFKVVLNHDPYGDDTYLSVMAEKYGLTHDAAASVELSLRGGVLHARHAGCGVHVDFTSGQLMWRRHHGGGEAIARAVGVKSNYHPYVLDATGGFGTDAFVLAAHGCEVKLFERHPLIACLLDDGIRRARDELDPSFAERFSFEFGDSWAYLRNLANSSDTDAPRGRSEKVPNRKKHFNNTSSPGGQRAKFSRREIPISRDLHDTSAPDGHFLSPMIPDVVYLDPMFPKSKNSALAKKNIKFLQDLLPLDSANDERLLHTALQVARNRVVVKRPLDAPCLGGFKTVNHVKAKRYRFDIYSAKAKLKTT